ncbi:MAG TPA: hypothetical protein VD929_03395 [Caulobacteraceae bacterium]|nr:hypothetical protein [Caulobacteraceae bacterium]
MQKYAKRGLIVALALTFAAIAGFAAAAEKTFELKKGFPYLENYLKLPAAERSKFVMVYRYKLSGAPQEALKLAVVEGQSRSLIPVAADGRVTRTPTLAQLKSKARLDVDAPKGAKLDVNLTMEPVARPAAEMDAAELRAAAAQATKGAKKAAGLVGMVVPTFDRVVFKGATGAEVVYADGRKAALPVVEGSPVMDVAKHPTARTVRFAKVPVLVALDSSK